MLLVSKVQGTALVSSDDSFSSYEVTLQIEDHGWPRSKLPITIKGSRFNQTIDQSNPSMFMFSNFDQETGCDIKTGCSFIGWSALNGVPSERLDYECTCPLDVNCVVTLMIYYPGDMVICDILLPY